jgi:C1A family cysteine protease
VANIESQYALKYKKLYSFSEQYLLDCDTEQIGCEGGFMTNAWLYLAKNNGIPLTNNVPYTGIRNQCRFPTGFTAKLIGYRNAGSEDEEIIKEFLYRYGPVSVSMHGNLLQHYDGGLILADDKSCPPEPMNHACLLVGYGTDPSGYDYWIAKNSWADDWGENGYFRIVRGFKACGMNLYASSSVVS